MALSWPAIDEGVEPVTRFSIAEEAEGWRMSTRAPSPIEKPRQLTMAVSEDWRIAMAFAAGVEMSTLPWATLAPVGSLSPARAGTAERAVLARSANLKQSVRVMAAYPPILVLGAPPSPAAGQNWNEPTTVKRLSSGSSSSR